MTGEQPILLRRHVLKNYFLVYLGCVLWIIVSDALFKVSDGFTGTAAVSLSLLLLLAQPIDLLLLLKLLKLLLVLKLIKLLLLLSWVELVFLMKLIELLLPLNLVLLSLELELVKLLMEIV